MARHAVRAGRPEPKAVIKAAPSEYERTHPVGSAERFLDQAAKEALAFAAAGGIPPPSRFIPGAVRAVAKEAEKYPDPLLAEAAGLPAKELARRAANAEAYRKAIDAQNAVVDTVSLVTSPAGNMAANQAGAAAHDMLTRQDWGGGSPEEKRPQHGDVQYVESAGTRELYPNREDLLAKAGEIDSSNIKGTHISIDPAKFNTDLPQSRRSEFKRWKKKYAPDDSGWDYDFQGAFLDGVVPDEKTNHWPDKFKKPNHPTFSVESKYATGILAELAGRWEGENYVPAPLVHLVHNRVEGWKHNGPGLVRLVNDNGTDRPFAPPEGGVTGEWAAGEVRKHIDRNNKWLREYMPGALLPQMPRAVLDYMAIRSYRNRYELGETNTPKMRAALRKAESFVKTHKRSPDGDDNLARHITRTVVQSSLAHVKKPEDFNRGVRDMKAFIGPWLRQHGMSEDFTTYIPKDDETYERMVSALKTLAEQDRQDTDMRVRDMKRRQIRRLLDGASSAHAYAMPGDYLSLFLKRHGLTKEQLDTLNKGHPDYDPANPVLQTEGSERYPWRVKADPRNVRQDALGGDASDPEAVSENPESVSENPETVSGGPRIVINPTTFRNQKDALCVAFNEGFRVWMEANGFEPQSEPTDAQRRFFSDTAYADDEVQLRRTILARIATFDTSVKDPTDDQLAETAGFLNAILESDWCRNDWERNAVSRLANAVQAAVGAEPAEPKTEPLEAREAEPLQRHAAMGGGETDDEDKLALQNAGQSDQVDQVEEQNLAEREAQQVETASPAEASPAEASPAEASPAEASPAEASPAEASPAATSQANVTPEDNQGTASQRSGLSSGVWTGGEPGKGRQLTAREAEWARQHGSLPRSSGDASGEPASADDTDVQAPGQDGRIGIGPRIVDPETGKSRSSLSMNGPALKPRRRIGNMGSRSLTDTKHMR